MSTSKKRKERGCGTERDEVTDKDGGISMHPVTPYKFPGAANLNMHESEKMAAEFGCTGKGKR